MSVRSLWARQITNELKSCSCPGCTRNRAGISPYCATHKQAKSDRGDPLSRLPSRNELAIFKRAIALYLGTDPKMAAKVTTDLSALERRMTLPPSFCLSPGDIHGKLPVVAKTTGLRANWQHRHGRTYTEAVIHALALMGWMSVYYDTGTSGGLWRNRKAFLDTRAGAVFGDISKPSAKMAKVVSGAVKRHLGSHLTRHAATVYGRDFWSSPVATASGQSMTILDYAKLALRAANLL
ncbi:hypothetical protein [Mesorhizobium sp. CN2-181]|uniref:hypothetical protein n=1 Tax=Mesorhizobium yinganensis TaxID=3157707 RepID=UPI0032B72E43